MQETLARISEQITQKWGNLNKSQKIKIGVIAGIIAIAIGVGIFIASNPPMVRLFNEDLSLKQIGQVRDTLNTNKVYNKLESSGTSILVRQKDLANAKIVISSEGILQDKYTFKEALSKNTMGMTESEKRVNIIQAREGELSTIIKNMEGIQDANVKLTVPEEDPFIIKSENVAKAGVNITTDKDLPQKSITGIARFVSASVEGLDIKNVSIIDQNGNTLYPTEEDMGDEAGIVKSNQIQQTKEKEIEKKVIAILSPLFEDIKVTVNLKMNFDKYSEKQEKYASPFEDGKKGIPVTEQTNTSKTTDSTTAQEPGVASNGGDITQYATGSNTGSQNSSEQYSASYVVNKTISESEKRVGETMLDQSSLSVVVYRTNKYDQEQIEKKNLLQGMSWDEYKQKIKAQAINNKIVLDGDVLESIQKGTGIQNVKCYGYEKPVFIDKKETIKSKTGYIPIILLVMLIGGLAFVIIKKTQPVDITEEEPELSVEQMLASTKKQEEIEVEEIEVQDSGVRKEVLKFIDQKPELVAQLLRNWLSDDWE